MLVGDWTPGPWSFPQCTKTFPHCTANSICEVVYGWRRISSWTEHSIAQCYTCAIEKFDWRERSHRPQKSNFWEFSSNFDAGLWKNVLDYPWGNNPNLFSNPNLDFETKLSNLGNLVWAKLHFSGLYYSRLDLTLNLMVLLVCWFELVVGNLGNNKTR